MLLLAAPQAPCQRRPLIAAPSPDGIYAHRAGGWPRRSASSSPPSSACSAAAPRASRPASGSTPFQRPALPSGARTPPPSFHVSPPLPRDPFSILQMRTHATPSTLTSTHLNSYTYIRGTYSHVHIYPYSCGARTQTAGDCEGGGGRQPHLSHGARAHRHRRPGSLAIARTRPPHTLRT